MSAQRPPSTPPKRLALQFLNLSDYRDSLLSWQDEFFIYKAGFYSKIESGAFKALVMKFMQFKARGIWDEKVTKTTQNDVVANLDGLCRVQDIKTIPHWIEPNETSAKDYINLTNGLFNVQKFLNCSDEFIEEHSSDFFTVNQSPFAYDRDAKCPTWDEFLMMVLPSKADRSLLQEWFGYNLIPDTSFQKFMVLFGDGANGKSVVCTVLLTLLGKNCVSSVNLEAFDPKRTFPLAETVGKLANIVTDLNSFDKTAVGELKKFVAGDLMSAERKFKTPFFFDPTARLTFASNIPPHFSDPSDGIWRRLLMIHFRIQILDEEKQNRNLVSEKWWTQSGELPGIFNWALKGLQRLLEIKRFTQSESMIEEREQLRADSNPERTFLLNFYEASKLAEISSSYLYNQYCDEMDSNRIKPKIASHFSQEVRRTFPFANLSKNPKKRPDWEGAGPGAQRSRIWSGIGRKTEI